MGFHFKSPMPITYEFIQLWIIQNGHRDFAQDRKSFHSEFFSGFLLVGTSGSCVRCFSGFRTFTGSS